MYFDKYSKPVGGQVKDETGLRVILSSDEAEKIFVGAKNMQEPLLLALADRITAYQPTDERLEVRFGNNHFVLDVADDEFHGLFAEQLVQLIANAEDASVASVYDRYFNIDS